MSFKDNFLKSLQELSNSGRSSGGAEGSGGNGANNAVVASSPYANKFLTSLQEIQASEGAKKTRIESVNSFLKESGKTISGSKSGQLKVKPYRFKELRKQGGAILDYLKDNHLDASDELKKQLEEQLDELDKIISGFDWSERTDRLQEAREKIDGGQDGGTGRYRDLKRVTTIMDLYDEYGRVYGYDDDGKVIVPSYAVDLEHALQESGLGDYIGMSREEIEQEKVWLGYVDKYTGKQYKDTFWGNAKANYDMGRMVQDSSLAWNEYLDNPTEENRRKAETIDQLISEVAINNQEVYGDDGKFPWLSKSMANYLPQFFDQTGYSIGGGLLGLGVGRLVGNPKLGAKAGITAASGVYSYKTMQGAAFKRLMEAGYSEEVSAAAAHDEAVISSAIEMVDTAIDFATRFAGEGVNMLASGSLSAVKDMLAKTAGKNAFTRFATALGKYGINVEGERVEEILQELISIANETNPGQGKLQLIQDAFQIGMDILAGNDPENRERVGEAGDEGKKIAMMMGGADAAVGITVKGAARAGINSEYNRTYTQEQRQNIQNSLVEEGLKVAPDSQEVKNAKNRLDKGKDLTGVQVRELVDVNEQAIQTQAVKQRLEAMGESGNTDSIATAIVKKNRGEELSSGDRYAMSTSSIGDVVLRELASGEIWDHVADENKTTLESISQKYGTQAKAVKKIYEMGGGEQDPEKFDRAYEFAYNLGKNGGKWEYAKNSTATSYLTEQQREFAYNAGKYAGEKENQSIQVASQQGVETQMNPITAPAATEGGGVAANMNMEGMNNGTGEEVHLRQGVQRNDGTNPGGQVRTVEAAAGGVQNRQGEAQGRSGNGGGSQKAAAGRVSTADLGFDRGNQTKNLTLVVPATEKSRTLDGARAVAKKHGMDIVLFRGGNLEMKDQNGKTITARACVRGNTMYVRADHKGFSPEQLARHEAGHKQIERGEISPKQVYDKLASIYRDTIEELLPDGTTVTKSQCIDYMIEQYAIAYQLTDMTGEEVWEEIVCDSLADMNAFSPETARQAVYFLADTKNVAQMQREETKAQRTGPPASGDIKFSMNQPKGMFSPSEIQTIQNIGRKSVNNFTSADIKATEKFAKRYWQEMGIKSPFFRGWFGDWRVNDKNTILQIADQRGDTRGVQHNDDTGWDIQVSGQVFNETKTHRSTASREALPYLPYINDIVKKSVLLDSVGQGKVKSDNSLLMHSMYTVADIGHGPEVLKLYVEEMNDPNANNTKKRSYQLQNIEKAFAASVRVQGGTPSSLTNTTNTIHTIADLFAAVKRMDANFNPNPASKVVNSDGMPMVVYHQTGNDFTVFDPKHSGAGSSDQQTPFGIFLKTSDKDIGIKGKKQMALYANIRNPLRAVNRSDLTRQLKQLSADYAALCEDYENMNLEFQKKQEAAERDLNEYMLQWRKENPTASRRDIYEDETFNQLSDAEDDIITLWEQEDQKLSTKAKTAITKALRNAGYDGVFLSEDSGSWGRKTDAIIALDPEQVKSATDNVGTFDGKNPDIRFSRELPGEGSAPSKYAGKELAQDRSLYTYDFLTSLPDMKVTKLPEVDAVRENGMVESKMVSKLGMENALSNGFERDGKTYVKNDYTGRSLRIDFTSMKHSLNGDGKRVLTNARLSAVAGDVVKNAVPINALHDTANNVTGTYAMAAYAVDSSGREFVTIITVEQRSGNVTSIETYDAVHSVSGRQKRSERLATEAPGVYPYTNASFTISIADLLKNVNSTHQSILSDDVLNHIGEKRNSAGYYSNRVKFSRENPTAAELQRENTLLRQRLEYWMGQTKLTERKTVRLADVDKVAKDTLAKYQSEADFGKVRNAMKYLADDMRNLDTASITGFDMDALSAEDIFADMRESPVWDKLQARAEGIAETILDGSKVQTNEEVTGFVKDLRGFLKGRKISLGENKSDISDYNDFRKRNFGRFTLSDSGTPMDTMWMELQAEFGKGFFPDDITHPADQALHVEQWLNTAPEYANPYRADFRDNVGVLANEILDDLFSDAVRDTAPTFADRKASKLQEMERRLTESRKKISEIREEKNQMRKSYQESRAKSVDGRKKTVLRNQIKSLAEKFHQMAVAPQRANTRHAPVQLTNALYQFCDVFAESQERGAERRAQKDARIANMAKKIKAMRDAYANLDQDGLLLYYNQHAEELVNKLSGELSGTDIYDMSREQLEAVHDTMKAMMHAIVNANNIDSMEKDMGLMETVKKFSSEIDQVSVNQKDVAVALRRYKMWQMSPDVFFDYICGYIKGNVGQDVQKMFSGGSERMISVQREFYNMFRPFTETENKQNAKALREMLENPMKHTVDWGLKDGAGNPVETSRGMMLQAYMLLKQEDSLNSIAVGGFKIPRMDAYYKGNIEAAYGDATESSLHSATMEESLWDINREIKGLKRELKKAGLKDEDARQMESKLKELEAERDSLVAGEKARLIAMRDAIYEKLTPMERELVQTADQWYRYSGELMGDVYEGMYGYRPHLVEDYVPIHRDMDSVKMDVRDVNGAFNLENAGFTKERVKSTAPILLTDFFTELNKQSDSISRYYGFAQAQKDFNRIWNMKVPGMSTTIKGKVGAKFGKGKTLFGVSGETYVENYIKAVSGANQGNDILSTFYGNAASATLSLNLRVAFSQLASIPTASAVVGWKSMAAGFSKGIGTSLSTARKNELAQKSAWFFQRYRGNGGITEIAELNAKGGLWAKASSSKVGKLLFNWCQNFDVFATASMWAMAEDYVQSHGMKANSEGYQAAVEQVYEDIIRKTQPNYTVTERSDLLRDKRGGMKLLTMYKTQSNQNLNILMGANGEFRRMKQDFKNGRNGVTEADVKAAGKRLLNAVTSVTIGGTLTFVALRTMVNFLMAAVNPYRDDDTDEVTLEETLKAMGKEMLSSLFGMYALGGQVYDLLSAVIFQDHYYGISDSAISLIADVVDTTVDTAKKLTDEDTDAKEKWAQVEKELGAVLTAFGVPYNNAKKFLNAARQWYHDFENGTVWQFSRESTSDRQFHERFLRAFREGDMEKCGDVVAYLLVKSDAASDNEAKKYLRSGFKGYLKDQFVDGEVSAEEVRSVLSGYLDMDEEEVDEAITSWQGIVDTGNSLDEEKDLYLRKDISRKEYADYLVKYDGKKPEEADKFIKKVDFENEYHFSYSDRKDGYKKGKITANQLIQAMVDIDGKTREEARHTIAEYDWENAVPNSEGISWSAIQEYHEKAEPNGVSKRMYTKAWKIRNKTKGEDLDNDGKTDKDSKAKKVIRQIGELSISAEEKQAIAEVWWSKKTVNKYKTW